MNVLIYSGPEVLQTSLSHSITSLRTALFPNYAVQALSQQSLVSHPWSANCALLVFPACYKALSLSSISSIVESYVENGGSLLTIGASVRAQTQKAYPPGSLEHAVAGLSLSDDRTLHFIDRATRMVTCVDFGTRLDDYARLATLQSVDGNSPIYILRPEGTNAASAFDEEVAQPLARYVDSKKETGIAAVSCHIGEGRAVVWHSLIDHPLTDEPASTLLNKASLPREDIISAEQHREKLLRSTLKFLSLQLPERPSNSSSRPLPQFLTCSPSKPDNVGHILEALSVDLMGAIPHVFRDSNDTIHFHPFSEGLKILADARMPSETKSDPSTWQPKHVIACKNGRLPSALETPLFDIYRYYDELSTAHAKQHCLADGKHWEMGEALLYGEVVTSTQTMLDKNTRLLSLLPTPLLSLASHQLAGRGRGSNVWLSPAGCLQFSLLLRVSLSALPAARLVFVQYLFGLAVVEACRDEGVLGAQGRRVRLKWPNDIYVVTEDNSPKKIGGILVNTNFSSGQAEVVIGCGLNVWNSPPILSLLQLIPSGSDIQLNMERTVAIIMAKFERMWDTYLAHKGSFEPFMDLYLERWLHSYVPNN
ncbi:hypothetical protein AcW1_002524 [Taiwanofungus camphoratus]|nr:hypothetical protein AcW1_002524 [Antrodia cinnamomea]